MFVSKILHYFSVLSILHTTNMHFKAFAALMLPLAADAANVVVSNDDGWVSEVIRMRRLDYSLLIYFVDRIGRDQHQGVLQ